MGYRGSRRLWLVNATVVRGPRLNRHVIFNDPAVVKACHCYFPSGSRSPTKQSL